MAKRNRRERTKKHRFLRFIAVLAALALLYAAVVVVPNKTIKLTSYEYEHPGISSPVKLVLISDLHGSRFGENNDMLVNKIAAQSPELILMCGDFIDYYDFDSEKVDELCALISRLRAIAPVYYSYGNHEIIFLEQNTDIGAAGRIAAAGAVILDDTFIDLQTSGGIVRLGGMYEFAFMNSTGWESSRAYLFLKAFENTALPKILLCHRPDSFIFNNAYLDWDCDLILSGHTHGGIVRLPFAGAVYIPTQGWFPEYDYGEFDLSDTRMIITSGLSVTEAIQRLCNRPEICVITLKAQLT